MIKINRDPKDLHSLAIKHFENLKQPPFNINENLTEIINIYNADALKKGFFISVKRYLPGLIRGTPDLLNKIKDRLKPNYDDIITQIGTANPLEADKKREIKAFKTNIFKIFNYDKFVKNYNGWGAYALVKDLGINVCPYCNRNYINLLITNKGKTRARLDHWFDKGKLPFFALSFYNLIPSCHICNSDFKGSDTFELGSHIHPYINGYEDCFKFQTKVKKVDFVYGANNSFKIDIKYDKAADTENIKSMATKSIKAFKLKELYNLHSDIASDVILKAHIYNESYLNYLKDIKNKEGDPIFNGKKEVVQMLLNCYINIKDFEKRPMSKFIRDIAEEQDLLKYL